MFFSIHPIHAEFKLKHVHGHLLPSGTLNTLDLAGACANGSNQITPQGYGIKFVTRHPSIVNRHDQGAHTIYKTNKLEMEKTGATVLKPSILR